MKSITKVFILIMSTWMLSCNQHCYDCSRARQLIKSADTTHPYFLASTHCYNKSRDTLLVANGDSGVIHYTCYNRITGEYLPKVIFAVFEHNQHEAAIKLESGEKNEITVPVGNFFISAIEEELRLQPAYLKNIKVEKNKITDIKIYIGSGYVD